MISSKMLGAMHDEIQNIVKLSAAYYNPHLNVNVKAVKIPPVKGSATSSEIKRAKKKETAKPLNVKTV